MDMKSYFFGVASVAIGLIPWFLDKRGISVSTWVISVGGCLVAAGIALGLFHPLIWLLNAGGVRSQTIAAAAVLCLFVGSASTWWVMHASEQRSSNSATEKIAVVGRTYTGQDVALDGFSYSRCTVRHVTFIWRGEKPFDLIDNTFEGGL